MFSARRVDIDGNFEVIRIRCGAVSEACPFFRLKVQAHLRDAVGGSPRGAFEAFEGRRSDVTAHETADVRGLQCDCLAADSLGIHLTISQYPKVEATLPIVALTLDGGFEH